MSNLLSDTLRRRAERAETAPDADEILAGVRDIVERHARRRRNAAAASGGVLLVSALIAGIVLLAPDGGHATPAAGARPTHRTVAGDGAATWPAGIDRHVTPAAPRVVPVTPSLSSASALSSGSSSVPASGPPPPPRSTLPYLTGLSKIAAAPKSAPLSVAVVPTGWRYLGASDTSVIYGPAGTGKNPTVFTGKLALLIGERYRPDGPLPLTIAGHPARYSGSDGTVTVYIAATPTVDVTIQVPPRAHLTKAQVLRVAQSLAIRDLSHVAHG